MKGVSKMKKIAIFIVLLMTVSSVWGQYRRNYDRPYAYLGFTFGVGINAISSPGAEGSRTPGVGFDFGAHYTHFFSRFGFGAGMHIVRTNSHTTYNFDETTEGLTHADNPGAHYTLYTHFDDWKERQSMVVIALPVEAFYRMPVGGGRFFICGAGVEFDMPTKGSYTAAGGSFTTSGMFPALGPYRVGDMPEHGFATYDEVAETSIGGFRPGVGVLADLGMRLPLGDGGGVYVGLYATYGLTSLVRADGAGPLLEINKRDASRIDYHGTFGWDGGTSSVPALHLIRVGVKVGVDLASPMDN